MYTTLTTYSKFSLGKFLDVFDKVSDKIIKFLTVSIGFKNLQDKMSPKDNKELARAFHDAVKTFEKLPLTEEDKAKIREEYSDEADAMINMAEKWLIQGNLEVEPTKSDAMIICRYMNALLKYISKYDEKAMEKLAKKYPNIIKF